jgi:FkbM family methyltransferase
VMETGVYEPIETIAVVRMLSNAVDFVDLGANVGWYTLIAGLCLRDRGRVHSFEPDPDNFAKLEKNVARNGLDNVTAIRVAISDQPGNRLLYRSTDNFGDHRLYDSGDVRATVPVEVRTLDSYASNFSRERPVIVKMDTQGSELRILHSMKALLSEHPHEVLILCEFWPQGLVRNHSAPQEMIELLVAAGFHALLINPAQRTLAPVSWKFIAESSANIIAREIDSFFDLILYQKHDGLVRALGPLS